MKVGYNFKSTIFTKHGPDDGTVEHLHKDIRIENNIIKRANTVAVTITAADGVRVVGNRFENRKNKDCELVKIVNCYNVVKENNIKI